MRHRVNGRPRPVAAAAGMVGLVLTVVLTVGGVFEGLAPEPLPLAVLVIWTWFRLMTFSFLVVAVSMIASSSSDEDPGTL